MVPTVRSRTASPHGVNKVLPVLLAFLRIIVHCSLTKSCTRDSVAVARARRTPLALQLSNALLKSDLLLNPVSMGNHSLCAGTLFGRGILVQESLLASRRSLVRAIFNSLIVAMTSPQVKAGRSAPLPLGAGLA